MPEDFLVEATKQKQKQEFKTEQLQETIQETMQQNGFQAEEIQQQIQKPSEKRVRKVKRHGIVDKTKNLFSNSEEVYGINQDEVTDNYANERKDAFQQHLLEMCREHMNVNADSQFKKTISKIYEYARISSSRAKTAVKSEKLTQARSMIHRYIESKDSNAELNADQNKALEIMKMYKLYFETFTDGNLVVPVGAYEKKAVDEEPELAQANKSGIFAAKYVDVSNRALFPKEPSMEDIEQGGLGDCYLLAGLASVVMTDPMAIKKSMHDNGKTVTVRFYEPIMGTDGNEIGVRPVYITVNKTIVKDKYLMGETYAKSSLWVQMVEKAYAVWGYHVSGKTEARIDSEKQRIKEQLLANGDTRTPDEVEKEAKQRAVELVRGEKGSYEKIIGGKSSEFIKYFTGKESEMHIHVKANTVKNLGSSIADNMTRAMGIETIKLLTVNRALSQKDDYQEALERFTAIGGRNVAEKLLEMNEEHGEVSMAMVGGLGAIVADFHDVVIKRYAIAKQKNAEKKGDDEKISLSEPIYLEDLQDLLHEQIKKEVFTKEGKLRYGLDEKYMPVIDTFIKRMLQMIPEEQDKVVTDDAKTETVGVQFMHRTESGKYSKFAEREYKKIADALTKGYHVNVGTASLIGGKRKGLNGENVTGGIVETHGYTVMGTQEMDGKKFIKLRNPWASTTQRYVRSTDKNHKERVYGERDGSSSTDGIFLMELNDFMTRTDHVYLNKDNMANVLHVKESVFQFDDMDEKETAMVNADSYYAKAKEEQIRHGLKNKAQEEARHPEMAKWNLTLEFYASAGYENYVAELVKYNLLMTESNPYYIVNKAKADNTFQKLKEKLCSFAKDAAQQWLLSLAEDKINAELVKLQDSGQKSQKVSNRMEELNALLNLYSRIEDQLEQKNENFSDEASTYLDAMEHLLNGKQILDALQKEELEKAGLI